MKGIVYWITGLSGAGKTTIGTKLYYKLKEKQDNVVLLDGDTIKEIMEKNKIEYSKEARLSRGLQYSKLCKMLSDQGIHVICCTIAMYDEIRAWNKLNITNYFEIFIDVDYQHLIERDPKGIYKQKKNIVGQKTGEYEFPKEPKLIINNNQFVDLSDTINDILFKSQDFSCENADVNYWNNYYKSRPKCIAKPSDFAKFVQQHIKPNRKILDIGAGNGRDSFFFDEENLQVTSVDLSREAIKNIKMNNQNINAICDDFIAAKALYNVDFDYCYSRWTIHAIDERQENQLINNVKKSLRDEGLFFIEVRTINDVKYKMGDKISQYEYIYDGHYRRFIVPSALKQKLVDSGFEILFFQESDKFSSVGNDNPTLLRIIAKK